jgi:hypothetical protein
VPDFPSIVSKTRNNPMPFMKGIGKPAKEKSPAGEHPTGLLFCINKLS